MIPESSREPVYVIVMVVVCCVVVLCGAVAVVYVVYRVKTKQRNLTRARRPSMNLPLIDDDIDVGLDDKSSDTNMPIQSI